MNEYLKLSTKNIRNYYLVRVVAHLLMIFIIFMSIRAYWSPIANIEKTIPGFMILLFITYFLSLNIFFLLLSKINLRFVTFFIAAAIVVFLMFIFFTTRSTEGSEFIYFFRKYIWLFAITIFVMGALVGAGLSRWKYFYFVDIAMILTTGVYFFTLFDKFVGGFSVIMVVLLLWYTTHVFATEYYFSTINKNKETKDRFKRSFLIKYGIYMLLFLLLFLVSTVATNTIFKDMAVAAKKTASAYTNLGRVDESDPSPSHYIHDLEPYVSLKDEIEGSDKVLLFNMYIRNYKKHEKRYPLFYLQRFAMGKFDETRLEFSTDTEDPALASLFPGMLPLDRQRLPANTTFPLFNDKLLWLETDKYVKSTFQRDNIDVTIRLSPYVKDDTIVSPNFPTYISVVKKTPIEIIISNIKAKYGDKSKEGFKAMERSYKTVYQMKTLTYPPQLVDLTEKKLRQAALKRPQIRLNTYESNHFTFYGQVGGAVSSNMQKLTRRLTRNDKTKLQKIKTITDFYRRTKNRTKLQGKKFRYELKPGPPPAKFEGNYLEYFIFKNRKGYCQYYALASALMLRIEGIPARVAGGYLGIDRSVKNPGHFYIYAHQAHAWTEVFFDGIGWLSIDTQPYEESSGQYRPPSADGTPKPPPTLPEYTKISVGGIVAAMYPEDKEVFILPHAFQLGDTNGPVYIMPEAIKKKMRGYKFKETIDLTIIESNQTNVYSNLAPKELYNMHEPPYYMDISIASGTFHNDQIRENMRATHEIKFDIEKLTIDKDNLSLNSLTNQNKKPQEKVSLSLALKIFIVLIILVLLVFAFTPIAIFYFKQQIFIGKDDKERLGLLHKYITLRLFLLYESTFGYTRGEWASHLLQTYNIDIRDITKQYIQALYDPNFAPLFSNTLAKNTLVNFKIGLKSAFKPIVRIISFFKLGRLLSYLRQKNYIDWSEQ